MLEAWTKMAEPKLGAYGSSFAEVREWIAATSLKLLKVDGFGKAVENDQGGQRPRSER